jgi:hypothetical protein
VNPSVLYKPVVDDRLFPCCNFCVVINTDLCLLLSLPCLSSRLSLVLLFPPSLASFSLPPRDSASFSNSVLNNMYYLSQRMTTKTKTTRATYLLPQLLKPQPEFGPQRFSQLFSRLSQPSPPVKFTELLSQLFSQRFSQPPSRFLPQPFSLLRPHGSRSYKPACVPPLH